jgi:hypothetical protein
MSIKKAERAPRPEQEATVVEHASPEVLAEVIKRAKDTPPGMGPSLHPLTPDQAILAIVQAGQPPKPDKTPKK